MTTMKMTNIKKIRTFTTMNIATTTAKSRSRRFTSNRHYERLNNSITLSLLFLVVLLNSAVIQLTSSSTTTMFVTSFMIRSQQQQQQQQRRTSLFNHFQQQHSSLLITTLSKTTTTTTTTTKLYAAKQRSSSSNSSKGFGKQVEKVEKVIEQQDNNNNNNNNEQQRSMSPPNIQNNNNNNNNNIMLTSIDDSKLTVEERTAAILREKYNLKTIEEQQMDIKQYAIYKDEQKKKKEWIKKLKDDEDFDIMTVIPPTILVGIDTTLKIALTICSVIFILFGLLITVEAYTKATNQLDLLSNNIHDIIVNTIEPNFTTLFIILLSCSISLGIFSLLQLGSSSATYREK